MDTTSKEPENIQENEALNEVNSNENVVIETITDEVNEVIEPMVEITENLNGNDHSETEKPKKTRKKIEENEDNVTETDAEAIPEVTTEKVNEVIESTDELTEIVKEEGHTETDMTVETPVEVEIKEEEVVETPTEVVSETVEVVEEKAEELPTIAEVEEPVKEETPVEVIANVEEKIEVIEELPIIAEVEEPVKEETPIEIVAIVEEKIEELPIASIKAIDIPEMHLDIHEIDSLESNIEEEEESDINYDILSKEELVVLLEEVIKSEDINKVKTKVSLIKVAFIKIVKDEKQILLEKFVAAGGKKEEFSPEEDNVELRFRAAFDVYRERKTLFNDEQERVKLDNLAQKQAIIDELKELINSDETLKHTYDEFKTLQERWKLIGQVPRLEVNTLWQNYHFLVEKFFDKVKINKELKDLDMKKNMESKMDLCEKAEELLLDSSIHSSFKKLQNYHDEWKSIGPVPQDKRDELWERFKNISDQINDRRREFYEKQQGEHEGNLLTKNALCEKAEQIANKEHNSLDDYQSSTDELTEVIKIWKTVGPIERKMNDEIWARFKTYLDTFYANKKEYYDKLKEEQVNNLNLKVDLCLQAESIKLRNDWRAATIELLDLQKQWKETGPVPRKTSDKIWHRFRAACDEFFNNKNEFFKNITENETNNLKQKEELIEKVKAYEFGIDRNENLQALKDFQRQFTEIGFIPLAHKDRIQNEFRQTINKCFENLKMNSAEVSAVNFNNRVERMNPADASRFIGKERTYLQNKITQLKEDIGLWENNIGFLAHSKNADLLKQEFEKKINNAKQDLIIMEAKLKAMHTN